MVFSLFNFLKKKNINKLIKKKKNYLSFFKAGELLTITAPWLERRIHPTTIISGYFHALDDALSIMRKYASDIDTNNKEKMLDIIKSCIGTKFIAKWNDLMCNIALEAVQTVVVDLENRKEIDIKRYVKVERVKKKKNHVVCLF